MQLRDFEIQFYRLKTLYGEKNFPPERERMFFRRYERVYIQAFSLAIDWIVLTMPNPGSLVGILDEKLRDAREPSPHTDAKSAFVCEACRDFGYGFVGDLIVRCVCPQGDKVSPAELAKQQGNYERGKLMFQKAGINRSNIAKKLPEVLGGQ